MKYQVANLHFQLADTQEGLEPPFEEYASFAESIKYAKQLSLSEPFDYGVWENETYLMAILKDGVWFGRLTAEATESEGGG